jgi:hypothetical protein
MYLSANSLRLLSSHCSFTASEFCFELVEVFEDNFIKCSMRRVSVSSWTAAGSTEHLSSVALCGESTTPVMHDPRMGEGWGVVIVSNCAP